MSLALLEDLIAVEDVADLVHVGPLLAWLGGHGLLDTGRVLVCAWCRAPFVRKATKGQPNRRYCTDACRARCYRVAYDARYPGRRLAQQRAKDQRRRALKVAA